MTMRRLKRFAFSAVLLMAVYSFTVFSAEIDNFSYDASTGTLLQYTGAQKVLTLPQRLGDTSITTLGASLFSGQELATVTIPASVSQISPETFAGKIRVNIETTAENTAFTSDNGMLYTKDMRTLLSVPTAMHPNIRVPETTVVIGENAFQDNWLCSTVTLPATVLQVRSGAFQGCEAMTVVFEGTNTEIAEDAFIQSNPTFLCRPRSDALYYALEHQVPYSLLPQENAFAYEITYLTLKNGQLLAGCRNVSSSASAKWMIAGFDSEGRLTACRLLPPEEMLSLPAETFPEDTASFSAYIWDISQMLPLTEACSFPEL